MRGYEISTTQCVAFPNGLLLLNFFCFHLCCKIRCCFFEFLIDASETCCSLNRRGQSSGQNFCLSSVLNSIEILFSRFRDRSCVLAFSLVEEKKRSNTRENILSHPSYQHSPIITHYNKNMACTLSASGLLPLKQQVVSRSSRRNSVCVKVRFLIQYVVF